MNVKQLPRLTECTLFKLGTPVWNGGQKVVGLDLKRIRKHNEITFSYVRKSDGQKSFPDTYYFDGENIKGLDYEIQNRKGVSLVLIPFEHLEILERTDGVGKWLN